MKKNTTIGLVALAMVAIVGITPALAFGGWNNGQGPFSADLTEEERAEIQETHEAILEAIENEDYEAWKELMEAQLTEERFEKIVEMHSQNSERMELMQQLREARKNGDEELAEDIIEQLEELGGGKGRFFRGGRGKMPFGQGCPFGKKPA